MKYNSVVLTLSSQQSSSTFQLLQLTNPWNEHERRRGCGSVLRSVCLYLYYKLIFTCHKNHGGADPGFLWLTAENGDVNIWRRVLVVPDLWVYRCLRPTLGRVCKCEWGRKRTTPSLSQSSQRERHPHISLHLTLQLVHSGVQPEQSSFHNDRQYSWWLSPSSWWEHEEELFVSKRFGRSDSFFQWCSAVECVKKKWRRSFGFGFSSFRYRSWWLWLWYPCVAVLYLMVTASLTKAFVF